MTEGYYIPAGSSEAEITVRNSRFVADAVPVKSAEDAREIIRRRAEEHPGSTHVVYAFIVGGYSNESSGMSDDGEPSGTAGAPVLDVIRGSNVFNLLVTVVRYFGGVKLGTGGLVRAYSGAARKAMEKLPLKKYVPEKSFSLVIPYGLHDKARIILEGAGARITDEEFTDSVMLRGSIPESNFRRCNDELANISEGKLSI